MTEPECTMLTQSSDERALGDFAALFQQIDAPCDGVAIEGGYAALLSRLSSDDYRRRALARRN